MVQLLTIIVIAVALAMDAFAVSIVSGATYRQLHIKHALRIALFFGGFQAFMPLIGSLAGPQSFSDIESLINSLLGL